MEQDIGKLEEKSIYILREAKSKFKNVAALWSMGKDSTAMLGLARKAFLGKVPFPVIHIDNGIDFPESYEFRDIPCGEVGNGAHSLEERDKGGDVRIRLLRRQQDRRAEEDDEGIRLRRAHSLDKEGRARDKGKGEIFLAQGQGLQVGLQEPAGGALEQLQLQGEEVHRTSGCIRCSTSTR